MYNAVGLLSVQTVLLVILAIFKPFNNHKKTPMQPKGYIGENIIFLCKLYAFLFTIVEVVNKNEAEVHT